MKNILFLIVLFFVGLNLLQASEIRTEVKEFTVGKKKKEKIKIERIYQGKKLLVTSIIRNGRMTRIFEFTKDFSCGESDEDGDGFMESFIIFNNRTHQAEAFLRNKDGNIEVNPTIAKKFKEGLEATDSLISLIESGKLKKNKCDK